MGRLFQILGALSLVFFFAIMPNVRYLRDGLPDYMALAGSIIIVGIGVAIHRLEKLERIILERNRETKNV